MACNVHRIRPVLRSPLVGASAPMVQLRARVTRAAGSVLPSLVRGETGAGKEVTARAIHDASDRPLGPFVAVNCGGISRDILEAELFGCEPGAFTGARKRSGYIAAAHNGTLFLDEVGELPLGAQATLLRVLETGRVTAVGTHEERRVDFRLVSATHRDLPTQVRQGTFRHDLYQRLAGIELRVPPLRAHPDDIADLATALCGPRVTRLRPAAWDALRAYSWPGNVRELRHVLLRTLDCNDGPIEPHHLEMRPVTVGAQAPTLLPLRLAQARHVANAVAAMGSINAAARVLECSPTTVSKYLALAPRR